MTTLELARAIAEAVLTAADVYGNATQAVLETLHAHDSWFCRVSEDANGITVDSPYEQQDLFR